MTHMLIASKIKIELLRPSAHQVNSQIAWRCKQKSLFKHLELSFVHTGCTLQFPSRVSERAHALAHLSRGSASRCKDGATRPFHRPKNPSHTGTWDTNAWPRESYKLQCPAPFTTKSVLPFLFYHFVLQIVFLQTLISWKLTTNSSPDAWQLRRGTSIQKPAGNSQSPWHGWCPWLLQSPFCKTLLPHGKQGKLENSSDQLQWSLSWGQPQQLCPSRCDESNLQCGLQWGSPALTSCLSSRWDASRAVSQSSFWLFSLCSLDLLLLQMPSVLPIWLLASLADLLSTSSTWALFQALLLKLHSKWFSPGQSHQKIAHLGQERIEAHYKKSVAASNSTKWYLGVFLGVPDKLQQI